MNLVTVPDDSNVRCPPGPGERISHSRRSELRLDEAGERMAKLLTTLEAEIVPRLLLSRRVDATAATPANVEPVDTGDADELARLLLSHEINVSFAYVEAVRHRGATTQQIYLQLLAPAARRLGVLWETDEIDFLQVTLGLGRLHQLLQRLSALHPAPAEPRGRARSALMATTPGEQHAFGVLMVSQFLRQNGWDVWSELPETHEELASLVRQKSFALVGLSAGSESLLDSVASSVRVVRRTSVNRNVAVMVGGALFTAYPEMVARVGADAMAADGLEAVARADSVCALLGGDARA